MKKILIGILIIGILGGAYGMYMYFKPNPSMNSLTTDLTLSAVDLLTDFENDETIANEKYLDKVIAVSGTIKEMTTNDEGITTITLDANNDLAGVICELEKGAKYELEMGDEVTLKGQCTGMLMDVVLVRCVLN